MTGLIKDEITATDFEVHGQELQGKARLYRAVEAARMALSGLALVASATILGLSADVLAVYKQTHLPPGYMLPLWPENLSLKPTNALVACGAIGVVMNALALMVGRSRTLKARSGVHAATSVATPFCGLLVAIVAVGLFYSSSASAVDETLQSYTCLFKDVAMVMQPHFGTLCRQNQAGLALAILMIPLEFIVLAVAGYGVLLRKKVERIAPNFTKGPSPALSQPWGP